MVLVIIRHKDSAAGRVRVPGAGRKEGARVERGDDVRQGLLFRASRHPADEETVEGHIGRGGGAQGVGGGAEPGRCRYGEEAQDGQRPTGLGLRSGGRGSKKWADSCTRFRRRGDEETATYIHQTTIDYKMELAGECRPFHFAIVFLGPGCSIGWHRDRFEGGEEAIPTPGDDSCHAPKEGLAVTGSSRTCRRIQACVGHRRSPGLLEFPARQPLPQLFFKMFEAVSAF